MEKFIYVFTDGAKEKLLEAGYRLIQSDTNNLVFVFVNDVHMAFSLHPSEYVISNTLSFDMASHIHNTGG